MKIRVLIFGGFMVVALFALILGLTGILTTVSLTKASTELEGMTVDNSDIQLLLDKHHIWSQEITESFLTGGEIKVALDPNNCYYTVWSAGETARTMSDPRLLEIRAKLEGPHAAMHNEAKVFYDLVQEGRMEEASRQLQTAVLPKARDTINYITDMEARYTEMIAIKQDESELLGQRMEVVIIVMVLLVLGGSVALAYFITQRICEPILPVSSFMKRASTTGNLDMLEADVDIIAKCATRSDEIGELINGSSAFIKRIIDLSDTLVKVAGGDLSVDVKQLSDNDTLGKSMNDMIGNMNRMFGEIDVTAKQVSTGARHIADGAQSLAQSSTEQASSVESLSDNISGIADMTKTNAEMANKAAKLADVIKGNAEKGNGQMSELMTAVDEINLASQNIGKVIKVIDDIAFQTNILALNAAVEAARAGQHGKGFAVVAEEVRNLAAKSADAAKDTGAMIQNSIEKAELGFKIAGETASSLADIVSEIGESNELVAGIAKSSVEQSVSISNINTSIDEVSRVVQHNSATAQQSAAASVQMSGQSGVLETLVSHFKLKEHKQGIGRIRSEHGTPAARPGPMHIALDSAEAAEAYGKY